VNGDPSDTPEARRAKESGLVACARCGHSLEYDHRDGCRMVQCPCRARWTVRQIEELRRAYRLVGRWYD
jgi:hypothetical protein